RDYKVTGVQTCALPIFLTLAYGSAREAYTVCDGKVLAAQLAASRLVTGTADASFGSAKPATGNGAYFGTGSNPRGANGADAGSEIGRASCRERGEEQVR